MAKSSTKEAGAEALVADERQPRFGLKSWLSRSTIWENVTAGIILALIVTSTGWAASGLLSGSDEGVEETPDGVLAFVTSPPESTTISEASTIAPPTTTPAPAEPEPTPSTSTQAPVVSAMFVEPSSGAIIEPGESIPLGAVLSNPDSESTYSFVLLTPNGSYYTYGKAALEGQMLSEAAIQIGQKPAAEEARDDPFRLGVMQCPTGYDHGLAEGKDYGSISLPDECEIVGRGDFARGQGV